MDLKGALELLIGMMYVGEKCIMPPETLKLNLRTLADVAFKDKRSTPKVWKTFLQTIRRKSLAEAEKFVWNAYLKACGLGELHGFGTKTKTGDSHLGNPEYSTIVEIGTN